MNNCPHLVFIVPTFSWPAPRTIRARRLTKYLSDDYFVTIICFSASLRKVSINKACRHQTIEIPYSLISRYVTLRRYSDLKVNKNLLFLFRPLSYVLKRFVFFPDAWSFENKKILKVLVNMDTPVDVVIASMMPCLLYTSPSPRDRG